MTISNVTSSIRVQGTGLQTTFSYDFYMVSSANAVLVRQDASGLEEQISSADFSITGVTSSSGGTFTYPLAGSAITAGESLTLYRIIAETQDAAIGNQGNFYPSVVEGALDKLTMLVQQMTPEGDYGVPFLAGNPTLVPGVFRQIELGSGLTFSGNVISVSGISGSGSVTQINTGTGIAGGPITGVGTVSLSTFTSGFVLANFSGATAAPVPVQLAAGTGITFSGTTTSLTLATSGGTVAEALITEVVTSGSTTSVTFSSVTSSYRHLKVRICGRGTSTSEFVSLRLRFNGDTGSNYSSIIGVFNGATGTSAESLAQTSITRLFDLTAAGSTANWTGYGEITIGNYSSTTSFKPIFANAATPRTTASTGVLGEIGSGIWASLSAVVTVTVFLSSAGFVDGSIVSLYGVR